MQQQRQPMPMPAPMMQTQQPIAQAPTLPMIALPQVDINHFNSLAEAHERKQWVGSLVYPAIQPHVGDALAAKITGMVIDETAVNLPMMLTDQNYFNKNINEALNLLGGQTALAQAQQQ